MCIASVLLIAGMFAYQPLAVDAQFNFGGVFDLNFPNGGRIGLAGGGYSPGPYYSYNPLYYSTYPYPYTATVPGLGLRYGYF